MGLYVRVKVLLLLLLTANGGLPCGGSTTIGHNTQVDKNTSCLNITQHTKLYKQYRTLHNECYADKIDKYYNQ
jgi:hypothetical protein